MNRRPQQQVKKVGGLVPTGVPLETLLPDGWRVTVAPEFVPVLEPQELVDFLNADDREARVLGEGRNRVLRRKLPRVPGTDSLDVAIKAFPPRSVLHDRIAAGRGTKARRAFDAAEFLRDHGVGTPGPIACVEHWRKRRLTGSWLVTVFVDGCRDFKSVLIDCFSPGVECAEIMARLETVARAIRRMHDAGFLHRDLGNQNILIPDDTKRDALFMDLNRGRIQKPLSPAERGRDLSRIYLPSDLLRVFIDMYWGDVPPPRLLSSERFHRRLFFIHTATRRWRHPLRESRRNGRHRAAGYPAEKDIWIWDSRSVQAVAALTSRSRHRHYPLSRGVRIGLSLLRAVPPLLRNLRAVRKETFAAKSEIIPAD